MDDDAELEVQDALAELRELLKIDEMWHAGSTRFDPVDLHRKWRKLNDALRDAAHIIHNPKAGQGLASIWIRAICQKVVDEQQAIPSHQNAWNTSLWSPDENIFWLATNGWEIGFEIWKLRTRQKSRLASLLEPETTSLDWLRRLADQWPAESQNAHDVTDDVAKRRRRDERESYFRRAGELLLQAVDELDVNGEWLADPGFRDLVLNSVISPSCLIRAYLEDPTPEALLAFVDKLDPRRDGVGHKTLHDDSVQAAQEKQLAPFDITSRLDQDKSQSPPYPKPKLYARDRWIYENIERHDCHSLSVRLKAVAQREKWLIISSRNGLKEAADRYADYHGFSHRRFPDLRSPY